MLEWAKYLHKSGNKDEAITWYKRCLEDREGALLSYDYWYALARALDLLIDSGRDVEALTWLMHSGISLDDSALARISYRAVEFGLGEEALAWMQSRVRENDSGAVICMVRLLDGLGRNNEVIPWLRGLVAEGQQYSSTWLIRRLGETGRTIEAVTAGYVGLELGHIDSMDLTTELLEKHGRTEEAEQLKRLGILPGGEIPESL